MTSKPSSKETEAENQKLRAFQGSETEVSAILSELSRNDSILQSYRDQFLVAETFTAAVAASALLDRPNIAAFVSFLGIPLLIGWVVVVRSQAKAFDYWSTRLAEFEYFQEYFQIIGKTGFFWARRWLGGGSGKWLVGMLQWVFAIFWLAILVIAFLT